MLLIAWTMPFLGDLADRRNKKGFMLRIMTISCIAFTCLISAGTFFSNSATVIAITGLIFFVAANYSYQGGLVFYNAFLPDITSNENYGRISGLGVSFGYLGAICGIILVSPFYDGTVFGWNIPGIPGWSREASFIPTAVLFLIFALPAFIYLKDTKKPAASVTVDSGLSASSLVFPLFTYLKVARELKLLRFLGAKFFYEESIETIIVFMSVYVQEVSGFTQSEANLFFIIVIPAAIIGAFFCGYAVDRFGSKKTLLIVLGGWIFTMTFVIFSSDKSSIWLTGMLAGIFLGSTWTSARPLLIELSPPERINECFGLYALSGKAAAIVGPIIWGTVVWILKPYGNVFKYKAAVGSLLLFMIIGFILLLGVQSRQYHVRKSS